jgi:alpha-glucosidase (family GH31 glycosyl hydrolase)
MKRRECLKLIGGAATAAWVRPGIGQTPEARQAGSVHFGASAITLGAPGRENALAIRKFLRAGGFPQATRTEASLWWDHDRLYVKFLNTELDPLYRGNPGLAKPIQYPGNERFRLSSYPDAVYVQICPDWKGGEAHTFAADSSGAREGDGFDTKIERHAEAWTAQFEIPWDRVGGRPAQSFFGLNLVRSRGQSSEILSPVALDLTLALPSDLLMVCGFGEKPALHSNAGYLIELPDQTLRWQLPAHLVWADDEERRALWTEQQELAQATTRESLPRRVALAQRLHDLLVLEGFSFHDDGSNWPIDPGGFFPDAARIAVNRSLSRQDFAGACSTLDIYLHQLDRVTRRWFADESLGNIRTGEWVPVEIKGFEREPRRLRLTASSGGRSFPLWLSASHGALRLRNENPGFFQPDETELVEMERNTFQCGDARVQIEERPWRIVVQDGRGKHVWSMKSGDLSTRILPTGEIAAIDLRGKLEPEENFYGFGERFNALGQRGNVVTLWDVDCWDGNIHGRFNQAYKNVPLMHSTRGYSLFWNTSFRLRADVGNANSSQYRLTAFGNILDLFLWPVQPKDALQLYTEITGRPKVPPRWAFEPWMGGGGRRWRNGPYKNAVLEEANVVKRFRELDIPHSAIYAEAGNDDPALYAQLKGTPLHVLAWDWASMDLKKVRALMSEVPDEQLPVLRHADGKIAYRPLEGVAMIDYTHPRALELIRRFWNPRLDLGLAGSMVDFGDVVPDDAVFYNGKRGVEMHNIYAYFYHQTFSQVFAEARGEDCVLFARSGCAGDQHSICHFAGDHQANFFGMRAAMRGGLNAAACGLSNWGADAGGYFGWPDPEVYIRWTEWATFCPLMRYHGTTPREPWEFGDDAVAIYKRHAWLRESLLPYIVRSAQEANVTGVPLMRPMPMEFPDSLKLANCDDQYMFGPDILVAPVLGPGESREVLFPPGNWTDFWTAKSYDGGRAYRIPTPLDRIGVFLRPGAFVPMELALSLTPGESMTKGRVKAALVTASSAKVRQRAREAGMDYLVVYTDGAKQAIPTSDFLRKTALR